MKFNNYYRDMDPQTMLSGIIKLSEENYVPEHVELRMKLCGGFITANFKAGDIDKIRKDPKLVDLSISEVMPLQKLPTEELETESQQ